MILFLSIFKTFLSFIYCGFPSYFIVVMLAGKKKIFERIMHQLKKQEVGMTAIRLVLHTPIRY